MIARMETEAVLLQETVLEEHEWLPWFLETEMAYTTTTAGDERVQLPFDFLQEVEEQALWYDTGTALVPLIKGDYDDNLQRYPGTGAPKRYSIGGEYLLLRPVPDATYQIKMRFLATDAALTTNIENKWLKYASDVFLAELGIAISEKHMQHFELAKTFRADAQRAWTRLYSKHVARQEINHDRVMEA